MFQGTQMWSYVIMAALKCRVQEQTVIVHFLWFLATIFSVKNNRTDMGK